MFAASSAEQGKGQDIVRKILQILNEPGDLCTSIQRVLMVLKSWTGVDAVGMRLQDGEDYPYFIQDGLSKAFLLTENTLLARDKNGGLYHDADGTICLECTCGLVIAGKTDPANPLFTRGGSYWTNDSFLVLELPRDQDPRLNARNHCIQQGYASVALIPVRTSERIVGLIQFNDKRKDRFSLAVIELLEDIAAHIGEALMRKQLESQLMQSQEMLRALLGRIEQAREEERARIARDMHDDLGQNLTAIKMDMRWIERAADGSRPTPDIGVIRSRAKAAIEVVDAMMTTVQELASSLRPGVLDCFGVAAAIRSEIGRFQARSGIACRASLPETLTELPATSATAIFRMCQECLTNIVRHSGATHASVRMSVNGGDVVLRVHDNGKGITPESLEGPGSLGVLGMKERAAALGGKITFLRGKRHGTLVTIRVPKS
jgi:signal transduction histidine kinase